MSGDDAAADQSADTLSADALPVLDADAFRAWMLSRPTVGRYDDVDHATGQTMNPLARYLHHLADRPGVEWRVNMRDYWPVRAGLGGYGAPLPAWAQRFMTRFVAAAQWHSVYEDVTETVGVALLEETLGLEAQTPQVDQEAPHAVRRRGRRSDNLPRLEPVLDYLAQVASAAADHDTPRMLHLASQAADHLQRLTPASSSLVLVPADALAAVQEISDVAGPFPRAGRNIYGWGTAPTWAPLAAAALVRLRRLLPLQVPPASFGYVASTRRRNSGRQ